MQENGHRHIGGKRLLTRAQALAASRRRLKTDYPREAGFGLWDTIRIPEEYKSKGIFVMGEQGSGKTVWIKYLLAEAAKAEKAKMVIHDFKMDLHPFLTRHLGIPESQIKILHPFDRRCCAWDIQTDMEDPSNASGLAHAFIPDPPPKADPFWTQGARAIVKAALLFFYYQSQEKPGYRWNLRHLIELLEDSEALKEIINNDGRFNFARSLINRKNEDLLVTILASTSDLKEIANLWDWPDKELFSIRKWRSKPEREILILGIDAKKGGACPTLNRMLWKQLYTEVIDQSIPAESDVWFVFDEFYWMSKLDGLDQVASIARSRRANLVLATQDIGQVEVLYGEGLLNIILQGCSTRIYFRCNGKAADWAARQIGQQKRLKQSTDQRLSGGQMSTGTGEQEDITGVVMSEDIESLRKCTSDKPILDAIIETFVDNPFHYPMEAYFFRHVWPQEKIAEDYQPETRSKRKHWRPLTEAEKESLGIPHVAQQSNLRKAIELETGRDEEERDIDDRRPQA